MKLRSPAEAIRLFGRNDENLKALRRRLGAKVVARGDEVRLSGEDAAVQEAERTFRSLLGTIRSGGDVTLTELEHSDLADLQDEPTPPEDGQGEPAPTPEGARLPGRAKPKTSGQRRYVAAIANNPITFGIGPAGTGKTYLAVAMAVQALLQKRVKRIVLTRPAVEAGEKLGFLPGDLQAKIDPYLRPLHDALYDMMPADRAEQYLEKGVIEVAPLAFMRGRTLNDAFIILDEAQNTTGEQMKMFLTRMGFGSTVVVTGDVTQTDLPGGTDSGLHLARRILSDIDGISFVAFDKGDVVRHPLVARIVRAYEERVD
ncbi:MAG: PhoH family protein [Trueperaceae bacterium]|nr:PhoH family protein [Trueperaceae bacterium]